MTSPTSCIHAGHMRVGRTWTSKLHRHPFIELMVIHEGALRVDLAGTQVHAGRGEVLYYPPQARHTEAAAGGACAFTFLAVRHDPGVTIPYVTADVDRRVTVMARWLLEEQAQPCGVRAAYLNGLSQAIMAELEKRARTPAQSRLGGVRAYLRAHLTAGHRVADLAARAGMSKYHFIRAYQRLTGQTPMADLQQLRIEVACSLLLTTNQPLKGIAEEVGFCDEYYFSRVFRRLRGLPPGAFRQTQS
jgi:AraC-like DNA-binding protein